MKPAMVIMICAFVLHQLIQCCDYAYRLYHTARLWILIHLAPARLIQVKAQGTNWVSFTVGSPLRTQTYICEKPLVVHDVSSYLFSSQPSRGVFLVDKICDEKRKEWIAEKEEFDMTPPFSWPEALDVTDFFYSCQCPFMHDWSFEELVQVFKEINAQHRSKEFVYFEHA